MANANPYPLEQHVKDWCTCSEDRHFDLISARLDVSGECWRWLLKPKSDGYGQLWHSGRAWLAHRFVYEVTVGQIPDGLSLDHLCRNRICVNPDHLEPVGYLENLRRGDAYIPRERRRREYLTYAEIPRRVYRSREVVEDDDPRHGTTTGYSGLKCRCQPCKDAHAAAAREHRLNRRNA